jgi:hypothetical protein
MSGIWDAMRLTGQPTTALGNAITNMIIHNRFYMRNRFNVVLMLLLGDDNILFSRQKLNVKNHGTETKQIYNLVSKVIQRRRVGDFLGMLMHTLDGKITVCPNITRMRENFSVSNYTHLSTERQEKIEQRVLSYCFLLGHGPGVKKIADTINATANIPNWYDVNDCIAANAMYFEVSDEEIWNQYRVLLNMMSERESIECKQSHWSSNPSAQSGMLKNLESKDAKKLAAATRVVLEDN